MPDVQPFLAPSQWTRIDTAQRDLDGARTADLADLDSAELILIIEQLRRGLYDTLGLVREIAGTRPPDEPGTNLPI